MRGVTHRAASKETGLSFDDTKRMGIESHTFFAPVPPWAMDDIKVRAVVAYRICITARQPKIPTTLEGLRKVERRYRAMLCNNTSLEVQFHLKNIQRFGGPLAYFTSLIYRRFRQGLDSPELAHHYGVKPTAIRQAINRLCRIARALFPNSADHLEWHHTSVQRDLPTLKIRNRARRTRRPTFPYGSAYRMRQAGRTLQQIADHFGLKTRTAVMMALRKYEVQKCN
jgi:uncharacterized protein (DUF433 family)